MCGTFNGQRHKSSNATDRNCPLLAVGTRVTHAIHTTSGGQEVCFLISVDTSTQRESGNSLPKGGTKIRSVELQTFIMSFTVLTHTMQSNIWLIQLYTYDYVQIMINLAEQWGVVLNIHATFSLDITSNQWELIISVVGSWYILINSFTLSIGWLSKDTNGGRQILGRVERANLHRL